ncbi:MAG TPA: hypothetical protein VGC51_11300 [Hansschlegelia sp.]
MKVALILLALLALAGCATQEQLAEADKQKCRGYGMRPGTEAFANCRMTLDVERRRELTRAFDDPYFGRGYRPYGGGPFWY